VPPAGGQAWQQGPLPGSARAPCFSCPPPVSAAPAGPASLARAGTAALGAVLTASASSCRAHTLTHLADGPPLERGRYGRELLLSSGRGAAAGASRRFAADRRGLLAVPGRFRGFWAPVSPMAPGWGGREAGGGGARGRSLRSASARGPNLRVRCTPRTHPVDDASKPHTRPCASHPAHKPTPGGGGRGAGPPWGGGWGGKGAWPVPMHELQAARLQTHWNPPPAPCELYDRGTPRSHKTRPPCLCITYVHAETSCPNPYIRRPFARQASRGLVPGLGRLGAAPTALSGTPRHRQTFGQGGRALGRPWDRLPL
jgi:hypothetical protein